MEIPVLDLDIKAANDLQLIDENRSITAIENTANNRKDNTSGALFTIYKMGEIEPK